MNILLSCVGRRNYLVEYFRQSLSGTGLVIGVNNDTQTAGMLAADIALEVPRVDDPEYIPTLLRICEDHDVGLLVSLFDIDLPYIAATREQFESLGVMVAIADSWVIDTCNDKWKLASFLKSRGIKSPKTYIKLDSAQCALRRGEIDYPVIVKPRWGMGSLSVYLAEDEGELNFFHSYSRKGIEASYLEILSHTDPDYAVIIQQFVPGQEYGVDVLNDFDGNRLATVVKRKLAMRSGETDAAEVVNEPRVEAVCNDLGALFKHRGNIDIDVISNQFGIPHVLEVNARFGGGYPFTHLAGARFTDALVSLADKGAVRLDKAVQGTVGLKAIQPVRWKRD